MDIPSQVQSSGLPYRVSDQQSLYPTLWSKSFGLEFFRYPYRGLDYVWRDFDLNRATQFPFS